ncbi:MAG: hypothetical protein JO340_16520 [Acidobacteriaceae bacterium]|nr:hypothetical protein [Acidobacteriaceae bacterium]
MTIRSLISVVFCGFGALTSFHGPFAFAQTPGRAAADASIRIVVVAGQNGRNALKSKTASPLIVEVRDAGNRPVPAAVVTFMAPEDGPGLVFSNGSRSQTLITEVNGRASVIDAEPVDLGSFKLSVTAAYDLHSATAAINQANIRDGAEAVAVSRENMGARTGMSGRTKFAIIGAIAVATGVGIAVALTHGKNSSSSTSTIGTGTPTVGAPH